MSTAQEWFEAFLLGKFELSYDENNVSEMRESALALYNLGVGSTAAQLFVAKNPIFFDTTLNPTLIANKLSQASAVSTGYGLAIEFAEFMDQRLKSCRTQVSIISQVFVPEIEAMTIFANKVFEESIGDYLIFVLKVSKEKETSLIYLHTLASTVYCCTQFLDFLKTNGQVDVNTKEIKESIISILKPYTEKYIGLELDNIQKKMMIEVQQWDKNVLFT